MEFPVEQEEIIQMSVSRAKKAGRYHLMQAENPVFILSFYFAGGTVMRTPRILIGATGSGSGKTTITCALLEILKDRGKKYRHLRCGPDYIDPMFHRTVLGIPSKKSGYVFYRGENDGRTVYGVCK